VQYTFERRLGVGALRADLDVFGDSNPGPTARSPVVMPIMLPLSPFSHLGLLKNVVN
jgi:hypothetical protein